MASTRTEISCSDATTPINDKLEDISCFGKLKDLEMMVPPQWWKTVFADSTYLKTDGDCVEDPQITKEEISLLLSNARFKSLIENGMFTISTITDIQFSLVY
jgi:hypothetical protein